MNKRDGTRKKMRQATPFLPRAIWEPLKEKYPDSLIFDGPFADLRKSTLHSNELDAPSATELEKAFPQVLSAADATTTGGGSWLHFAVTQGDLPLAHESLRLGASVQFKDRRNYSALYLACTILKDILLPDDTVSAIFHGRTTPSTKAVHAFVEQNIQICLLLLQHHADANETLEGLSLLGLASLSDQWDLIRALLLHGTDPFPSRPTLAPIDFLKTVNAKRFYTSTASRLSGQPRPRRPCPCGLGLSLDKCHATGSKAYPDGNLCPCGSAKTHAVCCTKRTDMTWIEQWDSSEGGRLNRACIPRTGILPALKRVGVEYLPRQQDLLKQIETAHAVLKTLVKNGRIDPAFAAAGCSLTITPLFPGAVHTMSKIELNNAIRLWNDAVDVYIVSSKADRRTREAIENAAKVGSTGGPLYRRCESGGCPKIEGRNCAKLSRCGGCSKVVYCSSHCQRMAWKVHKSVCKTGKARTQMLPSQVEFMAAYSKEMMKMFHSQHSSDDLPEGFAEAIADVFLGY
ncbi:hypothetical protein C8R46DRAFT_1342788 [Mycena filopes]|nr:hypothetical protein C8R46DRAFT_1342788 [Mycena filopes]